MNFTFTDWLWLKLIGGAALIFIVNFVYTLVTGRTIGEALSERRVRRGNPGRR